MPEKEINILNEKVINQIYLVRGQKVMLERNLTELYRVEAFRLNEQVKRNVIRFPTDFMFQLTSTEWDSLTSQIAISNVHLPMHLLHSVLIQSSVRYTGEHTDYGNFKKYSSRRNSQRRISCTTRNYGLSFV